MSVIIAIFALVAVAGATWVMFWGMGFFQYLGGKKKSSSAIDKEALKEKILALNSAELPYQITPAKESDLLLEWKIVDAKWYGIFSKEKISKTYRALILLDDVRKTARYYEELGSVQWHLGTDGLWKPGIKYSAEVRKGRVLFQKSWGAQYGIKESGKLGKIYEYKFDIGLARDPARRVIEESGWEFVPVVRKKYALSENLKN